MKITTHKQGELCIHEKKLSELIDKYSFVETIYFLFHNEFPTKEYTKMLTALFVSAIDHGTDTPSAKEAIAAAKDGKETYESLAAGILGFSPSHGIAGEAAMKFFYTHEGNKNIEALLAEKKKNKQYVSGFGHRMYVGVDPRSAQLFSIAKELNIYGKYCTFAEKVKGLLDAQSSKKLPINIDGAFGAILCDMGMEPRFGQTFFLIARTPGLLAQIHEEQATVVGE